jgi:hypothetical protein
LRRPTGFRPKGAEPFLAENDVFFSADENNEESPMETSDILTSAEDKNAEEET